MVQRVMIVTVQYRRYKYNELCRAVDRGKGEDARVITQ